MVPLYLSTWWGVLLQALLASQSPSTQPVADPAKPDGPARAPASAAAGTPAADAPLSSGDAAVDSILDRLETKGLAITDLRARVRKQERNTEAFPVEEKQIDEGTVLFRRLEPNPRFVVVFDRFEAGGVVRDRPEDRRSFQFDGQWLVERNDRTKRVIKRQAVRPGEKVDVFRLGQGPFPLPFGQTRRDMLTSFTITREPPRPDDPPDSDHLKCVPRPESDLRERYRQVDFYVDRKLELPVRIDALRRKDDVELRVDFTALQTNLGLAAAEFEIAVPSDYAVTVEPLADE